MKIILSVSNTVLNIPNVILYDLKTFDKLLNSIAALQNYIENHQFLNYYIFKCPNMSIKNLFLMKGLVC